MAVGLKCWWHLSSTAILIMANVFTSLLSLFNDVQGTDESILQYCSRFDGIVMELSCCKVAIPQIFMVMLFLRAIHGCYADLLEQFCTRFKSIETATIASIVKDITYHDSFMVHERKGVAKAPMPAPWVPAAASANTDHKGMVRHMPFEWTSKFSKQTIKTWWTHALAETGICPICHCTAKPWHIPPFCLLHMELNLKLDILLSRPAAQPAAQSSNTLLPSPPSHGGR
jgi:hypothetical protein